MRRISPKWLRAVAAASLVGLAAPALADESGRANATGSDSLSLNGHDYRLFGIDGLAINQTCYIDSQPFACGTAAVRALQTLIEAAPITCASKGAAEAGVTPATCTGPEGDVALKMLEQGWAVADGDAPDEYKTAEATAQSGKAGAWRGKFLTPAAYREEIAAIETRYAARAGEAARAEAEAAMLAGELDLRGLEKLELEVAEADASGVSPESHDVHYGAFAPGFIDAAIPPPAVFDWKTVAGVLEASRKAGVETIEASVTAAVWTELAALPAETVDTRNAETFYAALTSSAAEWIAAGRQPILYVMAPDLPNWVRDWFAGQPPEGSKVTRRDDRTDANYLGTIDGIDVYIGPGRERAALLVPSDILASVTYMKDADGQVLALQVGAGNDWLAQYRMALDWRNDKPVWLAFPQMAAPTPDAG
jgi:endonuclease YncB( thermonuclease family)